MSLSLPLRDTLICVYAPTLQADPATKEAFYSELGNLPSEVNTTDKILVMGDFNARVGRDFDVWPGGLGRHRVGNCNDNGRLLQELYAEQGLGTTHTVYQQKARFKTTWRHPHSKHWHLLDYISAPEGRAERLTHPCHAQCRLLHRSPAGESQAQTNHQTSSEEDRASSKEAAC